MKNRYSIALITLLAGTDALSKLICRSVLSGRDVVLIKGIVSLRLVKNTGAAFSMLANHPMAALALSAVLLAVLGVFLYKGEMSKASAFSLCAVFAGGLSNLIDRLINGGVTDMICVELIDFPVFNFADICVVLGVIVFAATYLFDGRDG